MNRFQINHAATWNCGRRGHWEIIHFKHHGECGWELDSLTVWKAQHLVIIKHSVHVLDPKCIDWPVKNDPFFSITRIRHVWPDQGCDDTISPFVCQNIYIPEQLIHGDWFWIQPFLFNTLVPVILWALLVQLLHSFGQSAADSSFPGSCQTYNHDSVTYHDCFHQLNDFSEEFLWLLIVKAVQLVFNGSLQWTVVDVGNLDFGEKICNDTHKQWQIVLQKLWHVRVSHGSDEYNIFR